jgi:hypothetical protein
MLTISAAEAVTSTLLDPRQAIGVWLAGLAGPWPG